MSDGWKSSTGVSDETGRAVIYCPESEIDEWTGEAERLGYSSRSEYLYELIHEAREYRQRGFLSRENEDPDFNSRDGKSLPTSRPRLVEKHLSIRFQSLPTIVDQVHQTDDVETLIRSVVEKGLYALAEEGVAEYRRGHGWRLTEEDEDG